MEMQYDKINGDVAFREADHKYFNIKHPARSYTEKFVGIETFNGVKGANNRYIQQPHECKFSLLNAKRFDNQWLNYFKINEQEFEKEVFAIQASYKNAADVACIRGTEYHNVKENKYYMQEIHKVDNLLDIDDEFVCQKNNFDLTRERAILPEYLLYYTSEDGILNLAGQADLIIKDGNDIYILDYKTNAKGIKTTAHFDWKSKKSQCMFFPINNLHDTTLIHYTIQLSIYAWMLQKLNPEFNIKMLKLLHVDGNGVETDYEVNYVKEDVERLLKHYKAALKVAQQKEKNKRIF
jgi:hypothetical protein